MNKHFTGEVICNNVKPQNAQGSGLIMRDTASRNYGLIDGHILIEEAKEEVEIPVVEEVFGRYDAPIDTGINVYHDSHIPIGRWQERYGTWQERYDADKESCWDVITSTDIVYFPGTRIIGTTPDDNTDIPILDDPSDGHGTAVTGSVLDANPDAVIFFVEGIL